MMKTCRCCLIEKPAAMFRKNPRGAMGLESYCRPCCAAKRRAAYHANPEPYRANALQRYRARVAAGKVTAESKVAKREYDRSYRLSNAAKLTALKAVWRNWNADTIRATRHAYKARRRSQEARGDSTADIRRWMVGQPKVCKWCAVDCANDFHVDHVLPLARGGAHLISNLCIACPPCNLRKNAKTPEDWDRHRRAIGMIE